MPDQIMNADIPEYRQAKNAPSQNSEKEYYDKGYKAGNLNGLRHAYSQIENILENIKNLIIILDAGR